MPIDRRSVTRELRLLLQGVDGLAGEGLPDALLREVQERNGGDLTDDVALLLLRW